MKSMTGFGTAEYSDNKIQLSIEIKSLNHRFKDIFIKLPRKYSALEDLMRKYASDFISRGRIEIFLNIKTYSNTSPDITYNKAAAQKYIELLGEMKNDFPELSNDLSTKTISQYQDVFTATENSVDIDELWNCLRPVMDKALRLMDESRKQEGLKLTDDLRKRITVLKENISKIEQFAPQLPKLYYQQLEKHLKSFSDSVIDEQKMITEMMLYADKINIAEEIVRIKLHFDNLSEQFEQSTPIGRKIDFTLQEINREANTIASKSNSFEISVYAVEIKSELEKIREQIQNIE